MSHFVNLLPLMACCSRMILFHTLTGDTEQVCWGPEEWSARGVGGVPLGWEEPILPAEGDLGHRSQSPKSKVQNLGGVGKLLEEACPTGEELGGGCQVKTIYWNWIVLKISHLNIVEGLPVMIAGSLKSVVVEVKRATLSWQPWWRRRGRGEAGREVELLHQEEEEQLLHLGWGCLGH